MSFTDIQEAPYTQATPGPDKARREGETEAPQAERNPVWGDLATDRPQTKPAVGAPGDAYEIEADRVADQVMRMPDPSMEEDIGIQAQAETPELQRQMDEAEEPEAPRMKGESDSSSGPATLRDAAASRIQALRGGGAPLSRESRAFFEPRFGRDFSAVRVHQGPGAAEEARSVSARAFTHGQDVVFGPGEYSPGSGDGRRLITHELAHVAQQAGTPGRAPADRTGVLRRQPDPMAVDKMSPATPRDPKKVTLVDYVIVDCAENAIRFYTDQGIFPYPLTYEGAIPDGVFTAAVSVEGNKVLFDFGEQAEEEGSFDFGWKIEMGKENPATFFRSQSSVKFILRGDKTASKIPKDIKSAKISQHLDNAKTIKYDSSYKATGYGGLSPWLQVTYGDGTRVDIHMDQIEDELLVGGEVLAAHKRSFIGKDGRITPLRINRQTAPNLFAAKYRAIEEQTAATNQLILGSVPAILFIISLGAQPAVVGMISRGGPLKPPKAGVATQGAKQGAKALVEMSMAQMSKFVQRIFRSTPLLQRLARAQKLT